MLALASFSAIHPQPAANTTASYCFPAPRFKHRTRCNVTANGCTCSGGCSTSWRCQRSALCDVDGSLQPVTAELPPRTAIVLFLAHNTSLVRARYAHRPHAAYDREFRRIEWFLKSARRVGTRLPIHVIVGPHRNEQRERQLRALGANITQGVPVLPPAWASKFHLMSFAKIGALALTQFDKVWVFDNDMALVHNIDDLAFAPTPAAVWHTAIANFQRSWSEACAVTTGLLGLQPSAAEFERAVQMLDDHPNRTRSATTLASYDGGDQGFWRRFYRFYELPVRYHAHQQLRMSDSDWDQVRVLHSISGLRDKSLLPKKLRKHIAYFY